MVIICWDGAKWAAYAFANNAEEAEELDPNDTSDDNPEEDCIAAHTGNCLDAAKDPIFDPRLYGIIHIEKDIGKYTEEWSEIHGRLKKSFKVWLIAWPDASQEHPLTRVEKQATGKVRIIEIHG